METKEGGSKEGGQGAPSMAHTGIDCVSERSDTAITVGLKPDETPDIAISELSTDNSAADIGV